MIQLITFDGLLSIECPSVGTGHCGAIVPNQPMQLWGAHGRDIHDHTYASLLLCTVERPAWNWHGIRLEMKREYEYMYVETLNLMRTVL